jgi:hypothetical protein
MKTGRLITRILVIADIPLLLFGYAIFSFVLSFFCFDTCPTDFQGELAQEILSPTPRSGWVFDTIFLVALATWMLFTWAFRTIAPRGLWLAIVILFPVIIVAGLLGAFISNSFHWLPSTETQLSNWGKPLLFAWQGLLAWSIVALLGVFVPKKPILDVPVKSPIQAGGANSLPEKQEH